MQELKEINGTAGTAHKVEVSKSLHDRCVVVLDRQAGITKVRLRCIVGCGFGSTRANPLRKSHCPDRRVDLPLFVLQLLVAPCAPTQCAVAPVVFGSRLSFCGLTFMIVVV